MTQTYRSGFAIFNYWHSLYGALANQNLPPIKNFSQRAKIKFNGAIAMLKASYGWDIYDIKNLMLFALMHDPLQLGPESYGDLDKLMQSARHFAKWRRDYEAEITQYPTERKAIYALSKYEHSEEQMQSWLDELEAFDQNNF